MKLNRKNLEKIWVLKPVKIKDFNEFILKNYSDFLNENYLHVWWLEFKNKKTWEIKDIDEVKEEMIKDLLEKIK